VGPVSTAVVAPGTVEEVEIHGISSQGAGVGRLPDGRTVFVARTAPGDRVRVRLDRVRPKWATASVVEVLVPAEGRRAPLCARYHECGGCALQHLPEEAQRNLKAGLVVEALSRIGGLERIEPPDVVGSPAQTAYRSRMSYTLRRLAGGRVVAGLHALGRPAHVIDIRDECVLPEPSVAAAWAGLRRGWGPGARLLPSGGHLRLTLRAAEGGASLLVEGGTPDWDAAALSAAVPELVVVRHRPSGADDQDTPSGSDRGVGAFEQVNRAAAELLRAHVVASAGEGGLAVDAYCGSGPYGRALAEAGWRVLGIEHDPEAAGAAAMDAPPGFTVRTGAVEDLLANALPADLVIVNPPRAGLDARVVTIILKERPGRLVYVSCDPATLARDLGRLTEAYTITSIRCFDLFPQTAHVETVVVMDAAQGIR